MPGTSFGVRKPYLSIIQGTLRQKVSSDTPEAVKREYELKNGTKGVKWELIFKEWSGKIVDFRLKDSEYGEAFELELEDAVITMNTESRSFADFAKKFMSANLGKSITFHPYDFEVDGKKLVGVKLSQGGNTEKDKLKNYYWDDVEQKSVHGFPEPIGNTKHFKKKDWQKYFLDVTIFLTNELTKFREQIPKDVPLESMELPGENVKEDIEIPIIEPEKKKDDGEIKLEDVPF